MVRSYEGSVTCSSTRSPRRARSTHATGGTHTATAVTRRCGCGTCSPADNSASYQQNTPDPQWGAWGIVEDRPVLATGDGGGTIRAGSAADSLTSRFRIPGYRVRRQRPHASPCGQKAAPLTRRGMSLRSDRTCSQIRFIGLATLNREPVSALRGSLRREMLSTPHFDLGSINSG